MYDIVFYWGNVLTPYGNYTDETIGMFVQELQNKLRFIKVLRTEDHEAACRSLEGFYLRGYFLTLHVYVDDDRYCGLNGESDILFAIEKRMKLDHRDIPK